MTGSVNVDLVNTQAVRTSASDYANMDFSSAANAFDGSLTFTSPSTAVPRATSS